MWILLEVIVVMVFGSFVGCFFYYVFGNLWLEDGVLILLCCFVLLGRM